MNQIVIDLEGKKCLTDFGQNLDISSIVQHSSSVFLRQTGEGAFWHTFKPNRTLLERIFPPRNTTFRLQTHWRNSILLIQLSKFDVGKVFPVVGYFFSQFVKAGTLLLRKGWASSRPKAQNWWPFWDTVLAQEKCKKRVKEHRLFIFVHVKKKYFEAYRKIFMEVLVVLFL